MKRRCAGLTYVAGKAAAQLFGSRQGLMGATTSGRCPAQKLGRAEIAASTAASINGTLNGFVQFRSPAHKRNCHGPEVGAQEGFSRGKRSRAPRAQAPPGPHALPSRLEIPPNFVHFTRICRRLREASCCRHGGRRAGKGDVAKTLFRLFPKTRIFLFCMGKAWVLKLCFFIF